MKVAGRWQMRVQAEKKFPVEGPFRPARIKIDLKGALKPKRLLEAERQDAMWDERFVVLFTGEEESRQATNRNPEKNTSRFG